MADFENNFNTTDFTIISPDGNISGSFGPGDYIRISLFSNRILIIFV